jgi:hypothetical protein
LASVCGKQPFIDAIVVAGHDGARSFEYNRLSIATAFRAWLTAERFFNLFRVQALGAYDRFHRHHCSSLVDDEEVLTYFKYEHFVLTVIHRHHCSRLVWR